MPIVRFLTVGLGKMLSKVFGLATMSFFGRLPSRDDDRIALVGVLSLTWLSLLVASAWPSAAELFIPFVDDEDLARLIAVALVVLVPLGVGFVVATMHNNRGSGLPDMLRYVLSGYLYVAVIGATVAAIVVTVPVLKASYIVRRFSVSRFMVMIPAGHYDTAVDRIRDILIEGDIEVSDEQVHPVISTLFRLLGWILGRVFDRDVADEMRALRGWQDGDWLEITVHAADISIIGSRRVVHLVRATLAEHLGDESVYLSWDDRSQALEDDINACRRRLQDGHPPDQHHLDDLVARLSTLQLDQEAWDAVRRLLYRLERDTARLIAGQDAAEDREDAAEDREDVAEDREDVAENREQQRPVA